MTEAELCAGFIEAATRDSEWRAYPETAGFDILMVRSCGLQVGIEAKLALNTKVVTQALPATSGWVAGLPGPHYRAVLVPSGKAQAGLAQICAWLGITVIEFQGVPEPGKHFVRVERPKFGHCGVPPFTPDLPDPRYGNREWHQWCPDAPCKVPGWIPDVVAGDSAPVKLTPWKVKAIKLAIILEDRPVHRGDFKALDLSVSRWTNRYDGWLVPTPRGYVPGPRMPDFKRQHPDNYEQIKADKALWMHAAPQVQVGMCLDQPAPAVADKAGGQEGGETGHG